MSSTLSLKERAFALRLQGKSYAQILRSLNLKSKGTLSYWFRDLSLTPIAKKRLKEYTRMATERGLFRFNAERRKRIAEENQAVYTRGLKECGKISKRELLLIGAALYWAEGTKSEGKYGYPAFSFTNSDPAMIQLCLRFIREILYVKEEKIRAGIHLYDKTDTETARTFWSRVTNLPRERFYTVNQISRASKQKRGHTLPFGTLHIKVSKRLVFFRVKGMIKGIIKNIPRNEYLRN